MPVVALEIAPLEQRVQAPVLATGDVPEQTIATETAGAHLKTLKRALAIERGGDHPDLWHRGANFSESSDPRSAQQCTTGWSWRSFLLVRIVH